MSALAGVCRWLRSGVDADMKPRTYNVDMVYGCHLYEGIIDKDGYGRIGWKRGKLAHRVQYEIDVGPIPHGKVLDHLCMRRSCCWASHLEPVTQRENQLRKAMKYRMRHVTNCPRGHSLASGMMTPEGGRVCRTCLGCLYG